MAGYGLPFTGDLMSLVFILILLAIISVVLSVLSLILVRSAVRRETRFPQRAVAPSVVEAPAPPKVPTPARKEVGKRAVKPSARPRAESLEIRPVKPEEGLGFTSLEELASMIGVKSVLLFNQSGIPIDSYNVSDDDRVAASVADFISLMRRYDPEFSSMTSENDRKLMLFTVGKVGDAEVFALAVSGAGLELGAEEVRDLLRAYLSESLGRFG